MANSMPNARGISSRCRIRRCATEVNSARGGGAGASFVFYGVAGYEGADFVP